MPLLAPPPPRPAWRDVDAHALQPPPPEHVPLLDCLERTVAYITRARPALLSTAVARARAIFRWVCERVALEEAGSADPQLVYKKRVGCAEGVSALFALMCSKAQLEAVKIIGFQRLYVPPSLAKESKDERERRIQQEEMNKTSRSLHYWNAVRLSMENGTKKWILIDCVMSMWSPAGARFCDSFFNPDPLLFCLSHHPIQVLAGNWQEEDSSWSSAQSASLALATPGPGSSKAFNFASSVASPSMAATPSLRRTSTMSMSFMSPGAGALGSPVVPSAQGPTTATELLVQAPQQAQCRRPPMSLRQFETAFLQPGPGMCALGLKVAVPAQAPTICIPGNLYAYAVPVGLLVFVCVRE